MNSFITYHKNDLEILTVVSMSGFQIGPSDRKMLHDQVFMVNMIVSREGRPHMISLN